jgi:diguanylate cyclase (GGDEF)-like protein
MRSLVLDILDTARFSYISVVVVLNILAAIFFFSSPARKISTNGKSINFFTAYFVFFAFAFVFFGLSLRAPSTVLIALNNFCFLAAFYCLLLGFKQRKLALSRITKRYSELFVLVHIALVVSVNIVVFYWLFDSYLMRSAFLIANCILIMTFALKYIPVNPKKYTYGEKIATASVVLSMLFGIVVLGILYQTNDTFVYMSSLVIAQSAVALLVMGGCLTTYLSDISDMYYRESITDVMTGLFNRRYFFQQSNLILKSAERHFFPISLLICDIDRFKMVNDTYGHDAGDEVIKTLAQVIKSEAREVDIVARHGGEEFIILLPQTEEAGAFKLAERIRSRIEQTSIATNSGELRITSSFGVVQIDESFDIQSHVKKADIALYKAKERGRNNVQAYDKTMVMV